ncbi:ribosome small subunit-stimulated GTPase EngC [Cutibacterium acnes JCM 18918]|nr:ribosome small subunit-stimulated GTPase EngC [Cutibacterium acnes JCM 18918]
MSPRRLASSGIDMRDWSSYDRPKRRTKPRTKQRPDYSSLPIGTVITIDRGRYRCRLDDGVEVTAAKPGSLVGSQSLLAIKCGLTATCREPRDPSLESYTLKNASLCSGAPQTTLTPMSALSSLMPIRWSSLRLLLTPHRVQA